MEENPDQKNENEGLQPVDAAKPDAPKTLEPKKNAKVPIAIAAVAVIFLVIVLSVSIGQNKPPVKEASPAKQEQPAKQESPAEDTSQARNELTEAVASALSLNPNDYTSSSFSALIDATSRATDLINDDKATNKQLKASKSDVETVRGTLKKAVSPVTVSGTGDDVVEIPSELSVCLVKAENNGDSNFVIKSLDANNKSIDLLVNTIGSYSGTTTTGMRRGTAKYLEVNSSGSWTITMSPVSQAPSVVNGAQNTGDGVVKISAGTGGKLSFSNDGSSNFVVRGISSSGSDLLVNEIGAYSGVVPNKNYSLLVVESDGSWTVSW